MSEWLSIWGNVPQGTLLGVLCFLCLINDLAPDSRTVKYVDDTTIYQVSSDPSDSTLQTSVNDALNWSSSNSMNIHPDKTKEMLISFAVDPPNVPKLALNGSPIERVHKCKLLGVILNDKLTWDDHVDKIYKKACSRLHFLGQLRRTKASSIDIVKVYVSVIRPIVEYACQVWHGGLTNGQRKILESIQQRALKISHPSLSYEEALSVTGLVTLDDRRVELCHRLFAESQDPNHKLFPLLPPLRDNPYEHRDKMMYPIPLCYTNRYQNSFIPYCLINFNT